MEWCRTIFILAKTRNLRGSVRDDGGVFHQKLAPTTLSTFSLSHDDPRSFFLPLPSSFSSLLATLERSPRSSTCRLAQALLKPQAPPFPTTLVPEQIPGYIRVASKEIPVRAIGCLS